MFFSGDSFFRSNINHQNAAALVVSTNRTLSFGDYPYLLGRPIIAFIDLFLVYISLSSSLFLSFAALSISFFFQIYFFPFPNLPLPRFRRKQFLFLGDSNFRGGEESRFWGLLCDRRIRGKSDRKSEMDRAPVTTGPMDMPIMHDSDRYDFVKDIGSGNFGVARLMRDKVTKELVAVKYIERGDKVFNFFKKNLILFSVFTIFGSCWFYLIQ